MGDLTPVQFQCPRIDSYRACAVGGILYRGKPYFQQDFLFRRISSELLKTFAPFVVITLVIPLPAANQVLQYRLLRRFSVMRLVVGNGLGMF